MNKTWLNKKGNNECILFFNGWGMDAKAVSHLDFDGFDVCMYHDYNSLSFEYEDYIEHQKMYLVAWSLGVWISSEIISQSNIKIEKAIALNGTLQPIDETNGIAPAVYDATMENWDETNRLKFNMRMMGGRKQYEQLLDRASSRNADDQKSELMYIRKEVLTGKKPEINFDTAFIGSNDMIFLPANQKNYWNGRVAIVEKEVPHYPFGAFENWGQIIEL